MKQFRFSYLENKVLYTVYVKRGQTDEPSEKCMCKYSHVKPESKRKECALAVYTNDAINIQFQSCALLLLSISRLNHKFATIKI